MFCTKCGNQVTSNVMFCPSCGAALPSRCSTLEKQRTIPRIYNASYVKPLIIGIVLLIIGVSAFHFIWGGDEPEDVAKKWISCIVDEKYDDTMKLYSVQFLAEQTTFFGMDELKQGISNLHYIIVDVAKEKASSFTYSTQKITDSTAIVTANDQGNRIIYIFEMAKINDKWLITKDRAQYSSDIQAKLMERSRKQFSPYRPY